MKLIGCGTQNWCLLIYIALYSKESLDETYEIESYSFTNCQIMIDKASTVVINQINKTIYGLTNHKLILYIWHLIKIIGIQDHNGEIEYKQLLQSYNAGFVLSNATEIELYLFHNWENITQLIWLYNSHLTHIMTKRDVKE